MPTFTPPSGAQTPPVSVRDREYAADTRIVNPLGYRLMIHYAAREQGCNVYKMSDGTYRVDPTPDDQTLAGMVLQPYPATTVDLVPNGVLSNSYYDGTLTVTELAQPTVAYVYYGAHSYHVSTTEAANLTAAGFGAYLTEP